MKILANTFVSKNRAYLKIIFSNFVHYLKKKPNCHLKLYAHGVHYFFGLMTAMRSPKFL